jgi:hypothetical protein
MFTIESVERLARERECRFLLVADEAKEIEDAALRDLANYQEIGTSWGCATFVAARMRKIQSGLVADDHSAEAIRELWEKRIEPFVWANSIWHPPPRP